MSQILGSIGTPLQLAALALLLLAGLARVLIRSGKLQVSTAMGKMLINRVFVLAMVALVLGLASPILASIMRPADATYYGAVRSTAGGAVPGATVELITIGQTQTNSMGQFDLIVPSNRVQAEYRVQASAPGYKSSVPAVRSAAQMHSLEIELEPVIKPLVGDLEQPLLLGQFFGSPFVVAAMRVENPKPSIVLITDVRATLVGPEQSFPLSPAAFTILGQWGPYSAINGAIPIFAGAQIDLRILLAVPNNMSQLFAKMAALPEYSAAQPCKNAPNLSPPLTDAAFALFQDYASDRFVWSPGEWRLRLEVVGDGQTRRVETAATLSAGDVTGLRNSLALARNCMGVTFQAPVAQDGRMANFVAK